METMLNILGLFFMVSGIAAWTLASVICVFYFMCQQPPKEK
jgi:hypothetical protein